MHQLHGTSLTSLALALALAGPGCGGGNEFTSSAAGGTSGSSGSGSGAASTSGGSSSGGSSTGGSAAGGSGGTGPGGSPASGGSGVDPTGGTGAGPVGGNGPGGSSGAGGTGMTRPGCGVAGDLVTPLLWTTLNDANSVNAPKFGDGNGALVATQPANDFHGGQCEAGVQIDGSQEFVRFKQSVNGRDHIDFQEGTLEFFFQPSYFADDDLAHFLFAARSPTGGFHLRKAGQSNKNHLQFVVLDDNGFVGETQVEPANVPFSPGVWVRITITWDFDNNGQQVRIYFDGMQAPYSNMNGAGTIQGTNPNMPSPQEDQFIYIGAVDETSPDTAGGLLDDFKIYDKVLVP